MFLFSLFSPPKISEKWRREKNEGVPLVFAGRARGPSGGTSLWLRFPARQPGICFPCSPFPRTTDPGLWLYRHPLHVYVGTVARAGTEVGFPAHPFLLASPKISSLYQLGCSLISLYYGLKKKSKSQLKIIEGKLWEVSG